MHYVEVVRVMLTLKKVYTVAQAVAEEPTRSTRHGALQLGLSRLVLHNKNLVMQNSGTFFFEYKFGQRLLRQPYYYELIMGALYLKPTLRCKRVNVQ